ncbi:MAG: PepSY domain-containing protein [Actinomycetota bacterium]
MSTIAPLRSTLLTALALSGALALASCSTTPQIDAASTAPPQSEPAESPTSSPSGDPTSSSSESPTSSPTATTQGGDATAAGIEGAVAAIGLAESETGATAYEIDDGDDDSWEIELADGTEQVTVHVSADGATVLSTERDDDVDDDDRAALDAAGITLVEAIEAAAAEAGDAAALDDATLEDDSDGPAWEVSFDDDVEVHVSVTDGSVLRVDR